MIKTKTSLRKLLASEHKPAHYEDAVASFNELLHNSIAEELLSDIPGLHESNIALSLTGSDGRHEKSPRSLVELIVLNENSEDTSEIREKIQSYASTNEHYDPSVEFKDLSKNNVLFFYDDSSRVFPTRVLDAKLLLGNKDLFSQYKTKLVSDLIGPEGKRCLKRFDEKRRASRHELTRLEKRLSFDESSGLLFFDDNRIKATKYSHLRPVQYKLAADLFKGVRKGNVTAEYLETFPKRTINRLAHLYFGDRLNISSMQLSDISSAYSQSLYWFHLAEEKNLYENCTAMQVDAGELKEVTKIIKDFSGIEGSILR